MTLSPTIHPRKVTARLWLKMHPAGETRLARRLRAYFGDQANSIVTRLADVGPIPELLFDEGEWHDELIKVATPALIHTATTAAGLELSDFLIDVPPRVMTGIRQHIGETMAAPYWRAVQATTRYELSTALQSVLERGGTERDLARAVRATLGGDVAASRAKTIARTETTGALNSGQHFARRELIDEGLITGIEWLAVLGDGRTRETHAANDGTVIGAREQFNVGGHLAPYPGHYSLPAHERINCRCTTATVTTFADTS